MCGACGKPECLPAGNGQPPKHPPKGCNKIIMSIHTNGHVTHDYLLIRHVSLGNCLNDNETLLDKFQSLLVKAGHSNIPQPQKKRKITLFSPSASLMLPPEGSHVTSNPTPWLVLLVTRFSDRLANTRKVTDLYPTGSSVSFLKPHPSKGRAGDDVRQNRLTKLHGENIELTYDTKRAT